MLTSFRFLPGVLLFTAVLRAGAPLDEVRRAEALLGPELWSRVILVQNAAPHPVYPAEVPALVFELAGILWIYTPFDGTQSFSLHRDNLPAEKADFGPLLRAIAPGFTGWRELPPGLAGPEPASPRPLRNGCFIASLVALRERVARGEVAEEPRLLAYHAHTPAGRVSHTVLAYRAGGRFEVIDTEAADPAPRAVAATPAASALELARALVGHGVFAARYLPLHAAALSGAVRPGQGDVVARR